MNGRENLFREVKRRKEKNGMEKNDEGRLKSKSYHDARMNCLLTCCKKRGTARKVLSHLEGSINGLQDRNRGVKKS